MSSGKSGRQLRDEGHAAVIAVDTAVHRGAGEHVRRVITRITLTVRVHVAVLVALVRHRRADRQEWEKTFGEPTKRPGWEDDPDTLRDLPVVRVPDRQGRHRGAA